MCNQSSSGVDIAHVALAMQSSSEADLVPVAAATPDQSSGENMPPVHLEMSNLSSSEDDLPHIHLGMSNHGADVVDLTTSNHLPFVDLAASKQSEVQFCTCESGYNYTSLYAL